MVPLVWCLVLGLQAMEMFQDMPLTPFMAQLLSEIGTAEQNYAALHSGARLPTDTDAEVRVWVCGCLSFCVKKSLLPTGACACLCACGFGGWGDRGGRVTL